MTDDEIIDGIRRPGQFDALVASEDEARRLVSTALPHAIELPPAIAGQSYANPPKGRKVWFQIHPAEPAVGNDLPHIKYADWTTGKKGRGGSWGTSSSRMSCREVCERWNGGTNVLYV
jgi:hypothetical protein